MYIHFNLAVPKIRIDMCIIFLDIICQRTQSKNQTRATWVSWCQQHCFRENEDWHVIYFLAPHAWRKYYLNCIMFFSMDRLVSKCKIPNEMSYNVFCCGLKPGFSNCDDGKNFGRHLVFKNWFLVTNRSNESNIVSNWKHSTITTKLLTTQSL